MSTDNGSAVLKIENLQKYYPVTEGLLRRVTGQVRAVDGVSLEVFKGETLGLVGESGCGKTTLGKCIARLYKPTGGRLLLRDENEGMRDCLTLSKQESFEARRRVQLVFQDPYAALNPVKNILSAFDEPMRVHSMGEKEERLEAASHMMETVNLRPDYLYRFPHEFSGGQRQRICIAKALAMKPEIVICDEPVSALDVSIQAQILNLMKDLQVEFGLTYVFIAHDLSVVHYMSDRIAVMYLGRIVELAGANALHEDCAHPYTEALLSAVPIPVIGARRERIVLKGDVPSPVDPPAGCRFHPRCSRCADICKIEEPPLRPLSSDPAHLVACHLSE